MSTYFVYLLTNPSKTVIYTGMTNDLERRLIEHFTNRGNKKSFTGKYYCYHLLHFEEFPNPKEAIAREKEIKDWNRSKKEDLIKDKNPNWDFLNSVIMNWPPPPEVQSNY